MAPFVAIAQTLKTVKKRIIYARSSSTKVRYNPEFPKIKPSRRKSMALNIERATGAKTPEKAVKVRKGSSPRSAVGDIGLPNSGELDRLCN